MNTIGDWIVKQIVTEGTVKKENGIKKVIGIYPGRFQPMGKHHAQTYDELKKLGFDEVWVATSDKVEMPKSPFSYQEKAKIIKSHGIKNVIKVNSPYKAQELLSKFDPETTAAVFMLGKKDADRLSGGKHFKKWKKGDPVEVGYREGAYVYTAKHKSLKVPGYGEMSGTKIRKALGDQGIDDKTRKKLFSGIFGHTKNYKLITDKLLAINEIMQSFISTIDIPNILNESSNTGSPAKQLVDDGPALQFTTFKGYSKTGDFYAKQMGWDVVDYILDGAVEFDSISDREVHSVTYFPAGQAGVTTPINRDDIKGTRAWKKYVKRISQVALRLGYEFVSFMGAESSAVTSKKEPNKLDRELKKVTKLVDKQRKKDTEVELPDTKVNEQVLTKEWWSGIMEDITIPVNIGDTVLMGKFKNKKVVVKTIGWNEKGDLLINGKSAMRMRVLPKSNIFDEAKKKKKPKKSKKASLMKQKRNFYLKHDNATKELEKSGREGKVVSKKVGKQRLFFVSYGQGNNPFAKQEGIKEGLITEGGAYGHMSHPFDDKGMTFGDFKNLIDLGLQGRLDVDEAASEKTDGQNLMVTWKDGKLKAARNKSTIKKPMDIKQMKSKFAGRGDIEKAFVYSMQDLEKAVSSLSDAQKEKIFKGGSAFMNLEIIYPASENIISYDVARLQFHGAIEYDLKTATPIGAVPDSGRMLTGMITQVNQNIQKTFKIIPPQIIKMKPHLDFAARKSIYLSKLNKLQKQFNLKDTSTLAEYHQAWWENYIDNKFKGIDNTIKMGLVKRWAFGDKSFRLNGTNISDKDLLDKIKKEDKIKVTAQVKKNMLPFETLMFELGADILKNAENLLAANPAKSVQNIRKKIASSISAVRKGGDLSKLKKVKDNLQKVQQAGGFKNIVPTEGIVIIYNGKTYKITGIFGPVNQIINALW